MTKVCLSDMTQSLNHDSKTLCMDTSIKLTVVYKALEMG